MGLAVETGDLASLRQAISAIESSGKSSYRTPCREYALAHFRKEDRYADYIRLYEECLGQ